MKKLKLFSKTYIFTMALISMIIIISHILIYLGLPKVYISNKEKESDNIIEDLIKEINKVDFYSSIDNIMYILKKYNINIDPFAKKIEEMVQEKSNNYKFGYYRPEITKLT